MDSKIKYLAKKVRLNVQEWVQYSYNFEVEADTMLGACAISSYTLWKILKANGIKCRLVCGQSEDGFYGHCWVEIGDRVLDVTCSQFGYTFPVVLFRDKKNCRYLDDFSIRAFDKDAFIIIEEWGMQSPLFYKNHIDKLVLSLTPN